MSDPLSRLRQFLGNEAAGGSILMGVAFLAVFTNVELKIDGNTFP
jgi:Na+/H+ antiporter NhaA